MSDNSTLSGWNSTDDDIVVPVRSGSDASAVPATSAAAAPPAHDISHDALPDVTIRHTQNDRPDPRRMTMSAVLGVLIAVGGIVGYLGLDMGSFSLTGDLLSNQTIAITITADGNFSPNSVEIHAGDTVTIENKNADPQVIKSVNDRDLFPVQVIFDEPYTFTVPDDATDTYVYFSETLPEDRTVKFTVTAAAQKISSEASSDSAQGGIPLPFGDGPPIERQVASTSSSLRPAAQTVEHSNDTATISLGGSASSSSSVAGVISILPTNPYTVASGLSQQQQIERIASSAASTEGLHSGAPIRELVMHKPVTVSQTGPAETMLLLLFLSSLAGVWFVSKKFA